MKTSIFISYTNRDQVSKDVAEKLFGCLEKAGFEPWLDRKRLKGGVDWYGEITENLFKSHAGVLLLTKEALGSEWVRKEANFLTVRAKGSPQYTVLPVLLDKDLDLSDSKVVKADIRVLAGDLKGLQWISCSKEEVPGEVIHMLQDVKERWSLERGEGELITKVKARLLNYHPDILLLMAQDLEVPLDELFPGGINHDLLAREVARQMTASKPGKVVQVIAQADNIRKEDAEGILACVYPFQINGEGAKRLAEAAKASSGAVGLNAKGIATKLYQKKGATIGHLYIYRAFGTTRGCTVLRVSTAHDAEGGGKDLVERIRKALEDEFYLDDSTLLDSVFLLEEEDLLSDDFDGDDADDADEVNSFVEKLEDALKNTTCFVILPGLIGEGILRRLQNDFKSVRFLILYPKLHDNSPLCQCKALQFLKPALDVKQERNILLACARANEVLKQKYRSN